MTAGSSRANPPTPSDSLPRQLRSLQCLRAIAALGVVYFHAVIQARHLNTNIKLPMVGATGVDIFFVLSGFLMWVTTRNSDISTRKFIIKRMERIAPLYWVLTIVVSACALLVPELLRSTQFDAQHLLASLFFVPWPNPAGVPGTSDYFSPVIIPGWTLNMEMMFYLLFAISISIRKTLRLIVVSSLIFGLYIVGTVSKLGGGSLSFYGDNIIFEFLMGVLLAANFIPLLRLPARWACGLLALSLVVLVFNEATTLPLPRVVKFGVPALFAIGAAINLERLLVVPDLPILVKLGDASYSIYLSHIFVLAALRVMVRLVNIHVNAGNVYLFLALGLVGSAAFGLIIHEYVEKPLFRFRVKWT